MFEDFAENKLISFGFLFCFVFNGLGKDAVFFSSEMNVFVFSKS